MNYPQIKPTLNLDFSNTKTLDPRINFRRGTPGAYYDGKTYAKAEENLIYPSIPDSNWTVDQYSINENSITAPDGTTTASKIVLDNGITGAYNIEKLVNVSINNFYTFSIYAKAGEFSVFNFDTQDQHFNQVNVVVDLSSGSILESGVDVIDSSITSVGDEWYRIVMVGKCILSASSKFIIRNFEDTGDGSSGFYLWGAQLEQRDVVTAYTPTNGTPVTKYQPQLMFASPDQPRFDHDALTGESKGLLIEESRTNLITYSQQIEQQLTTSATFNRWVVSASSSNALLNLNSLVAPDGTLSASKFYTDSVNGSPGLYQQVYTTDTTPETLTFSIFAKAGQPNRYLQLLSGAGDVDGDPFVNFNLFDGTISRDDNSIGSIEDVGNGWYRCIITFTTVSTSGVKINPVVYLIDDESAARASAWTGDGYSGIYIWGAQLEEGSFPTSYIKTSGASVTRSADNASITGENFSSWYRQDEGSIYSEASTSDFRSSYPRFMINDGTANNRIVTSFFGQQGLRVQSNGNDYINVSNAVSSDNGNYHKRAIALKKDFFSFYTDGESILSDSAGEMPISVNTFAFYNNLAADGADYLNGHIKKLSYYPQRLTNEQLQQLTK
jgi:hypothetical protein